ncbi:hypothetical protein LINPERHAP1_LOCUS11653, partial [Linum perenne]
LSQYENDTERLPAGLIALGTIIAFSLITSNPNNRKIIVYKIQYPNVYQIRKCCRDAGRRRTWQAAVTKSQEIEEANCWT